MTWFTIFVSNTCLLVQTTAFLSCTIQHLKQQNTDTEPLTSQKEVRCVHFQTHDTEDSSNIITDLSSCCVTFYYICMNVRQYWNSKFYLWPRYACHVCFHRHPLTVSQSDTRTSVTAVKCRKTGNKEVSVSLPPPTLEQCVYCVANNRGSALNSLIIPIHL